jgi:thiamine biosynthesis lipoprotein ApbE
MASISDMACATSAMSGAEPRACAIVGEGPAVSENAPLSVTVFAGSCAIADALTKVVWLRGAAALALLRSHGAEALIWTSKGTERLQDRLV